MAPNPIATINAQRFCAAFMVFAALVPLGLADPLAAEPEAEEEALGAATDDPEA